MQNDTSVSDIETQHEPPLYRYAACVEYDGANYCGWQRQIHSPSVQEQVERALAKVANQEIKVVCAGRTDTGVHATGQIIHFESSNPRGNHNWTRGATSQLPPDICVRWTKEVNSEFHARFSALSRTYRYFLLCRNQRTAICPQGITQINAETLNISLMQDAMNLLLGKRDFSAFRGAHCQASSPVREVQKVGINRHGEVVQFEIRANAFLLHMVRNIVGALIPVGLGDLSIEAFEKIILGLDRTKAPAAAAPNGLYLSRVEYPAEFDLPDRDGRVWFQT